MGRRRFATGKCFSLFAALFFTSRRGAAFLTPFALRSGASSHRLSSNVLSGSNGGVTPDGRAELFDVTIGEDAVAQLGSAQSPDLSAQSPALSRDFVAATQLNCLGDCEEQIALDLEKIEEAEPKRLVPNRLLVLSRHGTHLTSCDASGGSPRRLFGSGTGRIPCERGWAGRADARAAAAAADTAVQVQHPVMSPDGSLVAFAVLTLTPDGGKVESSRLMIVEEAMGTRVASARLQHPPFHLEWTPDGRGLTLLCDDGEGLAQLMEVRLDLTYAAAAASGDCAAENGVGDDGGSERGPKLTARALDRGGPLYYAVVAGRDCSDGATSPAIVAHNGARGGTSYWREDLGAWRRIAAAGRGGCAGAEAEDTATSPLGYRPQYRAPQPHRAGGAPAVLYVEGGWLISARVDGTAVRWLTPAMGHCTLAVSPDSRRAVMLDNDPVTDHFSLALISGEGALDPAGGGSSNGMTARKDADSSSAGVLLEEIPLDRAVIGFWWAPDSSKLLILASHLPRGATTAAAAAASVRAGGGGLRCQWLVYDCAGRGGGEGLLRPYGGFEFSPRPYGSKVYLAHFDQTYSALSPWAPDSRAFAYAGMAGAFVQRLVAADDAGVAAASAATIASASSAATAVTAGAGTVAAVAATDVDVPPPIALSRSAELVGWAGRR